MVEGAICRKERLGGMFNYYIGTLLEQPFEFLDTTGFEDTA